MNLANLPPVTDWHKPGLYVAVSPKGEALPPTLETTGYSTRASLVHEYGLTWSAASAKGYRIVELTPSAELIDTRDRTPA